MSNNQQHQYNGAHKKWSSVQKMTLCATTKIPYAQKRPLYKVKWLVSKKYLSIKAFNFGI